MAANFAPWVVAGREVSIGRAGCFPADDHLFRSDRNQFEVVDQLPARVLGWRLETRPEAGTATAGGGVAGDIVARPSDHILLSSRINPDESRPLATRSSWLSKLLPVRLGHLVSVSLATRKPVPELAGRLRDLGFELELPDHVPADLADGDVILLSEKCDGRDPWLRLSSKVGAGHLLAAAAATGRTVAQVADRLTRFGYRVPDVEAFPLAYDRNDLVLVSVNQDGKSPWHAGDWVQLGHLLAGALKTGRSPREVADRLRLFGFHIPAAEEIPDRVEQFDPLLLSFGLTGRSPWLLPRFGVTAGRVFSLAADTGISPPLIGARLHALGFRPPELPEIQPDDAVLISRDLDGRAPWLSVWETVPWGHLLVASQLLGRSPEEVGKRLGLLGYQVETPGSHSFDGGDPGDKLLVSMLRNGRSPWRSVDKPLTITEVLQIAKESGRRRIDVAKRLGRLGYEVSESSLLPEESEVIDQLMILPDQNLRGARPLDIERVVPPGHIYATARNLGLSVPQVVAGLRRFGFRIPPLPAYERKITEDEVRLLSKYLNGRSPWLPAEEPVPPAHVVRILAAGWELPRAVEGLAMFGMRIAKPSRSRFGHADNVIPKLSRGR
ncbi:hypothetical protein [Amycolatopsis sp. GM8]|uniref:wHTH domain-containing protein n=1 Tax=Amycolatopsis sp. GM8 TaxID=2896530 RepID=UPI001F23D971|nr:hypothetical protein [Amycolatopsis sp. GM8]